MIVSLNCHPEEVQRDLIVLKSGEVETQHPPLRRYQTRLTDTKNGNVALRLFTTLGLANVKGSVASQSASDQLLPTLRN